MPAEKKYFFISYSRRDKSDAEEFCRALDERKIPYWIDKREIPLGADFPTDIVQAISQSMGLILLLSDSSNESEYVASELNVAREKGKKKLPVMLSDVDPSDQIALHISGIHRKDFRDPESRAGLLDDLERELGRQPQPRAAFAPWGRLRARVHGFAGKNVTTFKLLAFVLACLTVMWFDSNVRDSEPFSLALQRYFSIATGYRYLVAADPRKPDFVLLVMDNELTKGDPCAMRGYIGELLSVLTPAGPAEVVLDDSFGAEKCKGSPENNELVAGAVKLCDTGVKVVVAQRSEPTTGTYGTSSYGLAKSFDFKAEGAACVVKGLADLYTDFRRVALTFGDTSHMKQSEPPATLAYAAARAFRPDLPVEKWLALAEPPYASVAGPDEFQPYTRYSRDFLCANGNTWRPCDGKAPALSDFVKKKIVIIGQDWDYEVDQHETVGGIVQGYVVQASFLKSLLDLRLFDPPPQWVEWIAGFLVFACFEYFVWRTRGAVALLAFVLLLIGVGLTMFVAVRKFQCYLDPLPFSILAVVYSRAFDFVLARL